MRALLDQAWLSLEENRSRVVRYVVLILLCGVLFRFGNQFLGEDDPSKSLPPETFALGLVLALVYAAAVSVVQALVFADMGRRIDRPLWKCAGPRDAFQRFFPVWFLLNTIGVVAIRLELLMAMRQNAEMTLLLEFLVLIFSILMTPVGACLMFSGGLDRGKSGETFAPLINLFPMALIAFGIGFVQYVLQRLFAEYTPKEWDHFLPLLALYDVPILLLDCLAFVITWRICMTHRDMPADNDDFEF